jgi:hypothetical protein
MNSSSQLPDELDYSQIFTLGKPTKSDLIHLVQYYVSDINYEERSKILFYFDDAFNKKTINPTLLLITVCSLFSDTRYMALLGYCLRRGADPNIYVENSTLADELFGNVSRVTAYPVHIMVHLLSSIISNFSEPSIQDSKVIKMSLLMLLKFGSNAGSPAYKTIDQNLYIDYNKIDEIDQELAIARKRLRDTGNITDYPVDRYLKTQYNVDMPSMSDLATMLSIPEQSMLIKTFGVYIDEPLYALNDGITPQLEDLVMVRAINIIKALPIVPVDYPTSYEKFTFVSFYKGHTIALERAIASVFVELWEVLIDKGVIPNYFDINYLIVTLMSTTEDISRNALIDMLSYALARGAQIDITQLSYFSEKDWKMYAQQYQELFWRKEGRTSAVMSERFKQLAIYLSLDLNDTKEDIVKGLEDMLKYEDEKIIDASKKRQALRKSCELGLIEDFIDGNIPQIGCTNNDYLTHEYTLYNDYQLAAYHHNKKVYCFTSERFEHLLSTGVNPITGEELPHAYKLKLKYLLSVLDSVKINPLLVIPITQALKIMRVPDEFNNNESDKARYTMKEVFRLRGIEEKTLKDYSYDQLNEALSIFDLNQDYFKKLTNEDNRLQTFYRLARYGMMLYENDQERVNQFFMFFDQ